MELTNMHSHLRCNLSPALCINQRSIPRKRIHPQETDQSGSNQQEPPHKKLKPEQHMHTLAALPSPPGIRQLQLAKKTALGDVTPLAMLHNLKLRHMNEVIHTMTEHGSTLNTLVTILNALPTPFAESHPQLSQDTRPSQQCHLLLLHSFRPTATTGDGKCASMPYPFMHSVQVLHN